MSKRAFTEGNWRKDPWFKALCKALADCKTEAEVAAFIRDVGTLAEMQAWSERFEVAKQVAAGKTYRDIADETGASTTTITRVARYWQSGEGGYRKSLNKQNHHHHHAASPAGRGRR